MYSCTGRTCLYTPATPRAWDWACGIPYPPVWWWRERFFWQGGEGRVRFAFPGLAVGKEALAAAVTVAESRLGFAIQDDRGKLAVFIAFAARATGSHLEPVRFNKLDMHTRKDRTVI